MKERISPRANLKYPDSKKRMGKARGKRWKHLPRKAEYHFL